jgi:CheY-like chemotaxis protein
LRQVLLNLVGNAVKFTSDGEVNMTAQLVGDDVDGIVTVELSVRDTGIGMSESTLEHLFDAFTQADSSTSRRYGGTGLGLAISRQLVELMGGTLHVTSAVGIGSTFSAVIPFPLGVVAEGAPETSDLTDVRVLIVDDNATNRLVLQEMVAGWGCTSSQARGADEALALLRTKVQEGEPIDVLLLDLSMPDIDGLALARMVRADPRLAQVPMIMLTSSAQRREAESAKQAGIVAYLTKPVRSAQLRTAMQGALGPMLMAPDGAELSMGHDGGDREASASMAAARTVLLVEDNVVNQKVLSAMLGSIGYRVDSVATGVDALKALDRHHYEAVLMDCQMPEMDGYQTTQELRQREGSVRHTHVIAVTASAMAADRARCLDAGMDDYLTKPIKSKDLAAKLMYWQER